MNTELTPTPPHGMRIIPAEELTKPLPMDAMCIMKDDPEDVWEHSGYRGELADSDSIALLYYATAEGVPDWRKLVEELAKDIATLLHNAGDCLEVEAPSSLHAVVQTLTRAKAALEESK